MQRTKLFAGVPYKELPNTDSLAAQECSQVFQVYRQRFLRGAILLAEDLLQVFGGQFADQAIIGRDDRVGQFAFAVL